MTKFKVITIKKRGGGTRKQRVQVLSSGKFKFVKNKTTPKRRSSAPKRKASTKKAPKRKSNKQRKAPKTKMAGKKKGVLSSIPLINNPTFKKAAVGVGTATIGVAVLSLVAPSIANQPLVKPVLAFAGGGVPGVIAQLVSQGGISALGIGGNGNGNSNTVNTGFA